MDLYNFCRNLPKIELHAHLNGSLSRATMLELQRLCADSGIQDKTNVFVDEFQIGAGDSSKMSDVFQAFSIAHSLTKFPEALALATSLTLEEFQNDGCYYIELRSTPRDTENMTKSQYIETLVKTIQNSHQLTMITRLIISINRNSGVHQANEIADLAIEYHQNYPGIVVGIELSGDPSVGCFQEFQTPLLKARNAGLKVTLHCGEIYNITEILEMLEFKPERIGHGIYIHPRLGGTDETWDALRKSNIPVEICLTSNVNTKSIVDYNSHHFKEFYEAGVPVILCTDDKGMFSTSLSQEYLMCAETFNLDKSQLIGLAQKASNYIFDQNVSKFINEKINDFIAKFDAENVND